MPPFGIPPSALLKTVFRVFTPEYRVPKSNYAKCDISHYIILNEKHVGTFFVNKVPSVVIAHRPANRPAKRPARERAILDDPPRAKALSR